MSCPIYPKIDTLYERGEDFKVDATKIRRPEFAIPNGWLVTEKVHGCNVCVSLETAKCGGDNCDDPGCEWVMRFNGRKENSQMPTLLTAHLQDTFTLEGLQSLWRCKKSCEKCAGVTFGEVTEDWNEAAGKPPVLKMSHCENLEPYPITLYGEGYGGGIQKGGGEYTSKTKGGAASFRLFDVLAGGTWLRRADVEDVAARLGVKCVPLLSVPDYASPGGAVQSTRPVLANIVDFVHFGIESVVAKEEGTGGHMAEGVVAFTEEPLYNNRGQRLMFKLKSSDFSRGRCR